MKVLTEYPTYATWHVAGIEQMLVIRVSINAGY